MERSLSVHGPAALHGFEAAFNRFREQEAPSPLGRDACARLQTEPSSRIPQSPSAPPPPQNHSALREDAFSPARTSGPGLAFGVSTGKGSQESQESQESISPVDPYTPFF